MENRPIEATELYKGSRDGFTGYVLYNKVDGKGNCLVLIKSTNGYRFGGFRSVPFDKNLKGMFRLDPKAFLFSLDRRMMCTQKYPND